MRRLYLHIGMHKTGSTSIQGSLDEGRAVALGFGVDYPDLGGNQSRVFNSAFGTDESGPGDPAEAERARARLAAALGAGTAPITILSAEALDLYRARRAGALAAFLRGFFDDIRVVVYVREPAEWASSQAQQHLRHGRVTIDDLRHPDPADTRRGRSIVPAYRAAIETYMTAFGRDRVDIRPFDPRQFVGGSLIADFCHAIGVPALAAALPAAHRNPSRSHEAMLLIDRLIEQERAGADPARTRALLSALARLPGSKFVLPADILEQVRRDCAADVAWLREVTGRPLFEDRPVPTAAPAWGPETLDGLVAILIDGGAEAAPGHVRPGFGARIRRWFGRRRRGA